MMPLFFQTILPLSRVFLGRGPPRDLADYLNELS